MNDDEAKQPKIRQTPVKPMRQELICECGGKMQFTGETMMMYPPKHVHQCPDCRVRQSMPTQFPRVVYVEEE